MHFDRIRHSFHSSRLLFVHSSHEVLQQIIVGDEALSTFLDIRIPPAWTEFGQAPFLYALNSINKDPTGELWCNWLPILLSENTLIGNCGYKGPPQSGSVEIGYEVASSYRGKGFASEIAQALCTHAFDDTSVTTIIAHTLAEENASVHVLRKCGFIFVHASHDPEDGEIWKWELPKTLFENHTSK